MKTRFVAGCLGMALAASLAVACDEPTTKRKTTATPTPTPATDASGNPAPTPTPTKPSGGGDGLTGGIGPN